MDKASKITILKDDVRRKIAAGEVIDRPFSVLRELIDNSLDAESSVIDCFIEGGGIELTQVIDNGEGMSSADIRLCWQSHATSKILNENDLLHITSLGFRGEALSSISAVSRLEIISKDEKSTTATKVNITGNSPPHFTTLSANRGTRIKVSDIFFNLPARRKFLASRRGESRLCRNVFNEKATAHPERSFRFFSERQAKIFLPPLENGEYLSRISTLYSEQCPKEFLHQISGSGEGFSFIVVLGLPPLYRSDRKFIQIYCNKRRIDSPQLVHAVEYAFSPILPGGRRPVAFVFLEVNPADIDINIHPSKKEVRFKKPTELHQKLRQCIQSFVEFYARQSLRREDKHILKPQVEDNTSSLFIEPTVQHEKKTPSFNYPQPSTAPNPARTTENRSIEVSEPAVSAYRYLGQIFSVFLLLEMAEELYIIDMHAAHERILFEQYKIHRDSENLLIPMILDVQTDKLHLKETTRSLNKIGFKCNVDNEGRLCLSAIPTALRGKEELIRGLITDLAKTSDDLETTIYAGMACRTAVKDGDILDNDSACRIIEQSFQLEVKRCPHGRPIWFKLSKKELFQLLGRIV